MWTDFNKCGIDSKGYIYSKNYKVSWGRQGEGSFVPQEDAGSR